jgi:site-specific recombinase XerD
MTPNQLITQFEQQRMRSLILQWQNQLLKEGFKNNTVRTHIIAVRSFFSSQKESIRGLKGKTLPPVMSEGEHTFSLDDLKAMWLVADTRNKAVLSLGCSLGWESSSFLNIERDFIKAHVERALSTKQDFASFDWTRKKTQSQQFGIITPLALQDLARYLALSDKKPSTKLFNLSIVALNDIIKKLAEEANLKLLGKVHFHLLRKWLMQSLSDAGFNEFEVKLVLGKSIGASDQTYLPNLKRTCFEKYRKCYGTHLSLTQTFNSGAKYNELVDFTVQFVKSQQRLVDYMKGQGMLKTLPQNIQDQLNSVYELAQVMQKKNGNKPEETKSTVNN